MSCNRIREILLCLPGMMLIPQARAFQSPVKKVIDTAVKSLKVVNLPQPYATKSVDRHSRTIGWPANKAPVAPRR